MCGLWDGKNRLTRKVTLKIPSIERDFQHGKFCESFHHPFSKFQSPYLLQWILKHYDVNNWGPRTKPFPRQFKISLHFTNARTGSEHLIPLADWTIIIQTGTCESRIHSRKTRNTRNLHRKWKRAWLGGDQSSLNSTTDTSRTKLCLTNSTSSSS